MLQALCLRNKLVEQQGRAAKPREEPAGSCGTENAADISFSADSRRKAEYLPPEEHGGDMRIQPRLWTPTARKDWADGSRPTPLSRKSKNAKTAYSSAR